MNNYGKKFELKLKQDFKKTVPLSTIDRIYDSMSMNKGIKNICDFIAYAQGKIFYLEAKSHKGASLPIENITQFEALNNKRNENIPGVRCGVVLWLYEKDIVSYIPISTIEKMKKDGKKSVGLKAIEEGYNIKILTSTKRRVFMDTDYSSLLDLEDGE